MSCLRSNSTRHARPPFPFLMCLLWCAPCTTPQEAELKKLEEDLKASGATLKKKNWPICYPMWHHDIPGEIPEKSRRVVREVYLCWWVSDVRGGLTHDSSGSREGETVGRSREGETVGGNGCG